MKNRRAIVVGFSVLVCACAHAVSGCGGNKVGVQMGQEGGPCYPNGTCNEGLECLSDVCVDLGPCTSGSTEPCVCTNGLSGLRTCGTDGTWGDCVCTAECGDGVLTAPEACDGLNLGGQTCQDLGYASGQLACTDQCTLDDSGCLPFTTCGDGLAEGLEACDGTDLRGADCASAGYTAGVLDCNPDCTLNVSGCTLCGNGVLETGEACDGSDLAGETCVTLGHEGGVLSCTAGCGFDESGCTDNPCSQAALSHSNYGCEFLAVDMANIDENNANEHCFVVVVTNPSNTTITIVTVEDQAGQPLDFPGLGTQIAVAPGGSVVLPISGTQGMCSLVPARTNANTLTSGLQPNSAFRIQSTEPVGAYQINPYEAAPVHTADSSMLIPTHALGSQYVALTFDGLNRAGITSPSAISIVALQNNTTVTVVPSAAMQPGGPVPAGGQFVAALGALDHLQILSEGYADLTSTLILASAPVAVFSGAMCSNVPMDMRYCDHLEEQMPPVNTLGATYVAAAAPQRASENSLWRIIAVENGTQVNILPYAQYDTVLNRGDILEVDETNAFLVEASWSIPNPPPDPPPVVVMNYVKGCEQAALESGTTIDALGSKRGDPGMTLSVPVDQYRNSYIFSSDDSILYNYVVVVRTDPLEPVHLDCFDPIPDARFQTVSGGYQTAVVTLSSETVPDGTCTAGVHRIWSASPFGIWVYGYDSDVSHAYPGGGNYNILNNIVITP